MYEYHDINEARVNSFFKSVEPNLRSIIMSKSAFLEHIKRSAIQVGWVWRECLRNLELLNPTFWGWKMISIPLPRFYPLWRIENEHGDVVNTIVTCSCKSGKCVNCKCAKFKEKCLVFCNCQRKCSNT